MLLQNKKILLVIGGGISAYKALDLIRLLVKSNVDVKTILTKSGREFVTSLSITSLSNNPVPVVFILNFVSDILFNVE